MDPWHSTDTVAGLVFSAYYVQYLAGGSVVDPWDPATGTGEQEELGLRVWLGQPSLLVCCIGQLGEVEVGEGGGEMWE